MLLKNERNIMEEKNTSPKSILDLPGAALALAALTVVTATLGGCEVYSDGRVASAFDQGAIKAELQKADKEYGGR
jgi:hypothetical protein